jgi:acetoin utilization deacetylase AcuC-like enzyme
MNVFYSPAYAGSQVSFETTRKSRWIAESLVRSPIAGVQLIPPEPLAETDLLKIHDAGYVQAIRRGFPRWLAESQGFRWDAALWPMVLASNGGAVAAAREALARGVSGSLSSGLHHARRDLGVGFCTFNGLALAAGSALDSGAVSVLILDLDAHWGGGTASLIGGDPRIWQLDVTVSGFDVYDPGQRMRAVLVREPGEYLEVIRRELDALRRRGPRFDLCLYNAGMDPFEGCSIGGLAGITRPILEERERLVFAWCRERGTPIAFVLGGGYLGPLLGPDGLVALHRFTIEAARLIG